MKKDMEDIMKDIINKLKNDSLVKNILDSNIFSKMYANINSTTAWRLGHELADSEYCGALKILYLIHHALKDCPGLNAKDVLDMIKNIKDELVKEREMCQRAMGAREM